MIRFGEPKKDGAAKAATSKKKTRAKADAKAKRKAPGNGKKPAASGQSERSRVNPAGEKREHVGGANPKLDAVGVEKVIAILRACGGIKSVAAERLNVSRTTLYKFISDNPGVADALAEIDNEILDVAEAQVVKSIQAGDMQTVRWFLETKGKGRGYTRRVEQTGPGGGPIETREREDLSGYTDEELQQLLAIREARERRETGSAHGA